MGYILDVVILETWLNFQNFSYTVCDTGDQEYNKSLLNNTFLPVALLAGRDVNKNVPILLLYNFTPIRLAVTQKLAFLFPFILLRFFLYLLVTKATYRRYGLRSKYIFFLSSRIFFTIQQNWELAWGVVVCRPRFILIWPRQISIRPPQ